MTVLAEQFLFDLGPLAAEAFRPRYNIAPTQLVAAVRRKRDKSKRELALFHWRLIPSWAKDKKIAYSTINARGDSVADKPAFRSAFKSRRCLVLADGYYEWITEGKKKLPLHYQLKSGKPLAFAGLWETWHGPPPHERDYDLWLDPAVTDKERLKALFMPYPAEEMSAVRVSMRVNSVKNEGPKCLEAEEA
jgi:putative SOS response-associated peptidase YedK